MQERLKQTNARGWFSPAVHCHCGAEWQLLSRWGDWGAGRRETPSVTTARTKVGGWGEKQLEGVLGKKKKKKRWLQATRWGGRRRWERFAVCMNGAVLWHQPPSIKEPLEGPRTVAAQEGGEERGCVRRKRHFSCPRWPQRSISGKRVGSKLSGRMMQPCDVRADTVSQVKARRRS